MRLHNYKLTKYFTSKRRPSLLYRGANSFHRLSPQMEGGQQLSRYSSQSVCLPGASLAREVSMESLAKENAWRISFLVFGSAHRVSTWDNSP